MSRSGRFSRTFRRSGSVCFFHYYFFIPGGSTFLLRLLVSDWYCAGPLCEASGTFSRSCSVYTFQTIDIHWKTSFGTFRLFRWTKLRSIFHQRTKRKAIVSRHWQVNLKQWLRAPTPYNVGWWLLHLVIIVIKVSVSECLVKWLRPSNHHFNSGDDRSPRQPQRPPELKMTTLNMRCSRPVHPRFMWPPLDNTLERHRPAWPC